MSIIPTHFNYTRTFTAREKHYRGTDNRWHRDAGGSDASLHEQINRWVDEEKVQLTLASAPSIQVLVSTDSLREYLMAMAVMNIPPTEGDEDVLERASDTGEDPRPPLESERGTVERVADPPGAQDPPEATGSQD